MTAESRWLTLHGLPANHPLLIKLRGLREQIGNHQSAIQILHDQIEGLQSALELSEKRERDAAVHIARLKRENAEMMSR